MDFENNNLNLRVVFWNNNGLLEEKSEDGIYITQFDIIFLSETWKSETFINKVQDRPEAYLELGWASAMQPFYKNG